MDRIELLTGDLLERGALLGVISEPRLPPGVPWPPWAPYTFLGARSTAPDTVAVLVLKEASAAVTQIPGVGDERAIWIAVECSGGTRGGVLVLGVYAPQPKKG